MSASSEIRQLGSSSLCHSAFFVRLTLMRASGARPGPGSLHVQRWMRCENLPEQSQIRRSLIGRDCLKTSRRDCKIRGWVRNRGRRTSGFIDEADRNQGISPRDDARGLSAWISEPDPVLAAAGPQRGPVNRDHGLGQLRSQTHSSSQLQSGRSHGSKSGVRAYTGDLTIRRVA